MADRQSTRPKSATLAPVSGSRAAGAVAAAWTWAHQLARLVSWVITHTPLVEPRAAAAPHAAAAHTSAKALILGFMIDFVIEAFVGLMS